MDCIILAAGNSSRFGENKLYYQLNGKSMYRYITEQLYGFLQSGKIENLIMVTQYEQLEKEVSQEYPDIVMVVNKQPELGISHSIFLGLTELENQNSDSKACMFAVADQPFLKKISLSSAIDTFQRNANKILVFSSEEKMGNPVIFPTRYYKDLLDLKGDTGGKKVVQLYRENTILFQVEPLELEDIDEKNSRFIRE